MEFQSHQCHLGMALNYGDLLGGAPAQLELHPWVLCGTKQRGGPALSEITENKIMGEMNGGARLRAAGEGVKAATNNTIYRLNDWVRMDRMERGRTDGRQGQHDERGRTPARCKACHWDTSPGYQKGPSEQHRCTPGVCRSRTNGARSGRQQDQGPAAGTGVNSGLLPVTCPAAPTTPALLSPCPGHNPEQIPRSKAALPHGGTRAESPAITASTGAQPPQAQGGWPRQPAGEEYHCSSASGLG